MNKGEGKSFSFTFRLLRKFGVKYSESAYGNISILSAAKRAFATWKNGIILKYCMYSTIMGVLNYRAIRPYLWKKMGCTIGQGVFIGYDVWTDIGNAKLVTLEDDVHIANKCIILCHHRNLSKYYVGSNYADLDYIKAPILLKKGCLVGMGSIILPGVTIGEGSIIGAGSVVTKSIPAWSIATGNPAKVIRKIADKD